MAVRAAWSIAFLPAKQLPGQKFYGGRANRAGGLLLADLPNGHTTSPGARANRTCLSFFLSPTPQMGGGSAFDLRATNARARTLQPTALDFVPYGWVLIRVQVHHICRIRRANQRTGLRCRRAKRGARRRGAPFGKAPSEARETGAQGAPSS